MLLFIYFKILIGIASALISLSSNVSLSNWPFQHSAVDYFLLSSTSADVCFSLPFPAKSAGDGSNNAYHLLSTSCLLYTKQ